MTTLRYLPAITCGALGLAALGRRLAALVRRRRDSAVPVVAARSCVRTFVA